MKYRILGSASGYPELGKHHSAYYIETSKNRFLFDCGEGTSQQLLRYKLADDEIDAIVISHYHADHVAGLFLVLQMFYLRKRRKKLILFLPEKKEKMLEIMNLFYSFPKRFTYGIEWLETKSVNSYFNELSVFPSSHLKTYQEFIEKNGFSNEMTAFSLLISENNKKLFISSDIHDLSTIPADKLQADSYILDGMHPPAEEILSFIEKYGNVILSHGLSLELENKIKNKEIELANETKIYYL